MAKLGKKRKAKESSFSYEEGEHEFKIISSEIVKNGKNKRLVFDFEAKKGKRVIKYGYNFVHENQTTERIALESLDSLAFACGLDEYTDSKDFHGCSVMIDVSMDGKYIKFNRYSPVNKTKNKEEKKKKGKKKPF